MRRTTACGTVGGLPRCWPCAFLTAIASFVRCEISRRSSCANVATTPNRPRSRRSHHGGGRGALRGGQTRACAAGLRESAEAPAAPLFHDTLRQLGDAPLGAPLLDAR